MPRNFLKYAFMLLVAWPVMLRRLGINVRNRDLLPRKGPAIVVVVGARLAHCGPERAAVRALRTHDHRSQCAWTVMKKNIYVQSVTTVTHL